VETEKSRRTSHRRAAGVGEHIVVVVLTLTFASSSP
jgi:hypothetical protein